MAAGGVVWSRRVRGLAGEGAHRQQLTSRVNPLHVGSFDFAVIGLIKQVKRIEGNSQVNPTSSPDTSWKLDGRGWQIILSQTITTRFEIKHVQPAVGKIAGGILLRFQ